MGLNEQILEQILTRQRKEYESLLENKFSGLDAKVGALDTKVAALDTKVNSLDVKIDQTEGRLEAAIVRQGEDYQRYMGVWAEDQG